METANPSTSNTDVAENEEKTNCSENPSDRESSIESFHTNKSEPSTTAETELIDIDDIELSDEESWLYKSPKKLSSEEKAISTYKWLHKEVEGMDDLELRVTKNALISKLNQLKMLNADVENRVMKEKISFPKREMCGDEVLQTSSGKSPLPISNSYLLPAKVKTGITEEASIEKSSFQNGKENDLDVMDVHKIARLQEESLRQSTSRFLNQTERKVFQDKCSPPVVHVQNIRLTKPASVEGLNTCETKIDQTSVYGFAHVQQIKKQNLFGSSASLHHSQDLHRGSLPNINRGYHSLRLKKTKHPSDKKTPCPLPIYPSNPKQSVNGTSKEFQTPAYESQNKLISPSSVYRESRTLPSSYRVSSRRNSASRKDLNALSPSPRRESAPFLSSPRSCPVADINRRESGTSNPRRLLATESSSNSYQRCSSSSPVFQNLSKPYSSSQNLRSPRNVEYHRNTSHSPSRRLPLTTVHNHSPKRGNSPGSPHNGEFRALKLPSKIPSPASRSGIPVPSQQYISGASEDESWSQDCF